VGILGNYRETEDCFPLANFGVTEGSKLFTGWYEIELHKTQKKSNKYDRFLKKRIIFFRISGESGQYIYGDRSNE